MLTTYFGFWDYWNLYHKVTFDGINRLIIINDGVTRLDVQRDIYSAWKEWLLIEENGKYLQAVNTVGGEPTIEGQFLDVTYFLINGWKLKPQPGTYTLDIVGNIFDIDGGAIFTKSDNIRGVVNNININTNTSVIVRRLDGGEVGGLTEEERTVLFGIARDTDEIQTVQLDTRSALFNIEDRVIAIENMFSQPIVATLEEQEKDTLFDIQSKLTELWKIHGLDIDNPMTVSKTQRIAGDLIQKLKQTNDTVKVTREK